jgi:hypothetical protein
MGVHGWTVTKAFSYNPEIFMSDERLYSGGPAEELQSGGRLLKQNG